MVNLDRIYSQILVDFGLDDFSGEEFGKSMHVSNYNLMLHRLCGKGYVARLSRGRYRAIHPIVLALERGGWRWRDKISQKEYLPIMEFVVARLIGFFWRKLVSLIVFGSVACGEAKSESDLDFLVVAEDLPERYSERLKLVRRVLVGVEDIRVKIWRERRRYPLIDMIILNPHEASISHPFYLDLVEKSIIVFDRENFMKNRLESLRGRLSELGGRRVTLPDGRWYWDLKAEVGRGEVVQL